MIPHTEANRTIQALPPEQLQHELDLARRVQQSLFPAALPALPGVTMAAVNHPARVVSGDLYDVIRIDPERIAVLCADVSGKGFAAALLASEVCAYVRASLRAACVFADASLGPLPVQVVTLLNTGAVRRHESGRYLTLFFAEFDSDERSLRYVRQLRAAVAGDEDCRSGRRTRCGLASAPSARSSWASSFSASPRLSPGSWLLC